MKAVLFFVCCYLLHFATAARQYVEIERRPNNNHDVASTLAFVFGLSATFVSVMIMLLLVGVMIRNSGSSYTPMSALQRKLSTPKPAVVVVNTVPFPFRI